jgi:hypothetical protein
MQRFAMQRFAMQRFAMQRFAMQRFAARAVGRQHRPESYAGRKLRWQEATLAGSYAGRKLRWQEAVFAECWRLYVQMPLLASARSPLPCPGLFPAARRPVRSGEAAAQRRTGRLRFPSGPGGHLFQGVCVV